MKRWAEYDYGEQMALIADALGVRYWSTADSIAEDIADLLDTLRKRGLQAEYVHHLANICFGGHPPRLTLDQVFNLITANPDRCYHAAVRALGVDV